VSELPGPGETVALGPNYRVLSWWRELADRAARNAIQVVIPLLITATTGSVHGYDPATVLVGVVAAAAVTVLKALAQISATADASFGVQLLDRALPAMAGALLTYVTVDLSALNDVDWRAAIVATTGAGLLALAQRAVSPPRLGNLTLAA
jgi:ABC-type Co2+ transport system permease subunit